MVGDGNRRVGEGGMVKGGRRLGEGGTGFLEMLEMRCWPPGAGGGAFGGKIQRFCVGATLVSMMAGGGGSSWSCSAAGVWCFVRKNQKSI